MSSDPKPLSKPWMATEMPFLQQYRQKTFEDGNEETGGYAKYSELQRPYLYDENVPPEYIWWEFIWPDINFPDIPTTPDTPINDCTVDEDCQFAKIIGSGEMQCGQCKTFSQFHYWVGCTIAPWWAAFGSWKLEGSPDGECKLISSGPVMATVCCSDVAATQTLTLIYEGPLSCVDSLEIVATCDEECCSEFEISGLGTVNAGSDWTGTISPACPGATCEVTSNSGCTGLTCEVNGAGSSVTVSGTTGKCGSFTVTVTDGGAECGINTASIDVRIIGGAGGWTIIDYQNGFTCQTTAQCNTGCGGFTCAVQIVGKYRYGNGDECSSTYSLFCEGTICDGCVEQDATPDGTRFEGCTCQDCADRGIQAWDSGCSPPQTSYCKCSSWSFRTCEWDCSC